MEHVGCAGLYENIDPKSINEEEAAKRAKQNEELSSQCRDRRKGKSFFER